MDEQRKLLERAHQWFAITYGQTANQAGYSCSKVWYKPIIYYDLRIHKYAEVVFGPSEKEVDAFIKAQKIIRWSLNVMIIFMLSFLLVGIAFLVMPNVNIIYLVMGLSVLLGGVFLFLGRYVKPLEKIYDGKILTHMEK